MNTTSDLIHRLRLDYVDPTLRWLATAWAWWTEELMQMLPADMQERLGKAARPMLLEPDGEHLEIFRTGDDPKRRTRIPMPDLSGDAKTAPQVACADAATLVMPAGKCLIKRVRLPAAAEQNLHGVLEFEMDRETPFSAEQVYFDAEIVGRSTSTKTIDVELVVSPRKNLEDLLRRLNALGLRPAAATARNSDGGLIAANLLPREFRPPRSILLNKLNTRLAAAAGVLLIAAVVLPLYQKSRIIAELSPRVEAAREAAQEGSRIRDNIERLHTAAQSLVDRKASEPMIIELLDETTRIIPDGTWLTQFEVDGDTVHLNGESGIAATLIELLDQSAAFTNPGFSAPVVRTRNTERERFDLSTQWRDGEGS